MPETFSYIGPAFKVCLKRNMPVVDAVKPIKIGIVGLGKIARDQHIPTLQTSEEFALVGVASPQNQLDGIANFDDLQSLATGVPELSAVAVCTPPQVRYEIARDALNMGFDVLLESLPAPRSARYRPWRRSRCAKSAPCSRHGTPGMHPRSRPRVRSCRSVKSGESRCRGKKMCVSGILANNGFGVPEA
jgi:hypothetical protein